MVRSETVDDVLRNVRSIRQIPAYVGWNPYRSSGVATRHSSWQFVTESTNVGLRSVVDRGDLLQIHFPNYIVVVSATVGALISYAINLVVVFVFALIAHVKFTGVLSCCRSVLSNCMPLLWL